MRTAHIDMLIKAAQRAKRIRAMVARGLSQAEVARRFKITRQRVQQIMRAKA